MDKVDGDAEFDNGHMATLAETMKGHLGSQIASACYATGRPKQQHQVSALVSLRRGKLVTGVDVRADAALW